MSKIRAITFDFWNTLFEEFNRAERHQFRCEGYAARTGTDLAQVLEVQGEVHAEFFRVHVREQRTLTAADAVRMTSERLGVSLRDGDHEALTELFATAIFDHPPVPIVQALDAVREAAARVPVALISDSGMNPGTSLKRILEDHGFTKHFTVLTFSDEQGVAKPHRKMFDATADALGVSPSEILHIGDLDPTDIAGIQALGGIGALFTAVNDRFADKTTADHIYPDWTAFRKALPQLIDA